MSDQIDKKQVKGAQHNWLVGFDHLKKFRYLWNLLNRSIIYASMLLSVIEKKERKRRKSKKFSRKNKPVTKCHNDNATSQDDQIKLIVEDLINKVEIEVMNPSFHDTSSSIESHSMNEHNPKSIQNSDIVLDNNQPILQYDIHDDACTSKIHSDSGIGCSNLELSSPSLLSSPANENESTVDCFRKQTPSPLCSSPAIPGLVKKESVAKFVVDDLCSEEDYVKSINKRKSSCSSPILPINVTLETKDSNKRSEKKDVDKYKVKQETITDKSTEAFSKVNKCSKEKALVEDLPFANANKKACVMDSTKLANEVDEYLHTSTADAQSDYCFSEQIVETHDNENAKSTVTKVPCPICNRLISLKSMNKHLDICSGVSMKQASLRNREKFERGKAAETADIDSCIDGDKEKKILKNIEKVDNCTKENISVHNENSYQPLCGIKQEPTSINKDSSSEDTIPTLPTGFENLKSALQMTVDTNKAVTQLVVDAAVAATKIQNSEQCLDEELVEKTVSSEFISSPLINSSPTFKVQPGMKHKSKTESSSSESEHEDIKVEVTPVPVRRSSRSTRSKRSYCEISSSSNDDDDDDEFVSTVNKKRDKPSKVRKTMQNEVNKEESCSKVRHLAEEATDKLDNQQDIYEEEVTGSDKINTEELLSRKFHKSDDKKDSTFIEINGKRYYKGQEINSAQPKYLTGGVLRDYQITGFQWLKLLFENGESGILADEMGLGKTIQSIAMICKLVRSGVKGPFLICAPTSTLNNWFHEFKKFAPKVTLLLYHGTALERRRLIQHFMEQIRLKIQIVMITSYDILMRDITALNSYCWSYLVLDEGHRVKNLNSRTIKQLKTLSISSKLMLTGTPLQNNLSELWSLLNFLLPEVFDDIRAFEAWFDIESIQKNEKLLSILHQILTPFVLRRVKADVEIKIPPKREILVMASLSSLQDKYYRATVDKSIVQLVKNKEYYNVTPGVADPDTLASLSQEQKDEKEGSRKVTRSKQKDYLKQKYDVDLNDYAINITLNNMLMQLRKCCNHPYLIQLPLQPGTDMLRVDSEIVTTCGKMMLLDRMLSALKDQGHKVLLFSQMTAMLDILEDYCRFREFNFVRFDGSTKCEDRFEYIKMFNEDPDVFVFLLSTRAGGLGINLTAADTVIIYDSDWNPQNDMQAQDRCHRIGQKNPVLVYRLVTMGTIDQQIVERAAMKRKLEKIIMHKGKFKGNLPKELDECKVITPEELLTLLESNTYTCVADNKDSVISDDDLMKLLDRSDMMKEDKGSKTVSDLNLLTDFPTPTSVSSTALTGPFHIIDETSTEKSLFS